MIHDDPWWSWYLLCYRISTIGTMNVAWFHDPLRSRISYDPWSSSQFVHRNFEALSFSHRQWPSQNVENHPMSLKLVRSIIEQHMDVMYVNECHLASKHQKLQVILAAFIYIYRDTYIYIHIYRDTYIYIYIYIDTHIYIYIIYIYIYIYIC